MNGRLQRLPAYLMLLTANALPVYGAWTGKLVFFQVLYLYWFESLILIAFDLLRIATAQGTKMTVQTGSESVKALTQQEDTAALRPVARIRMMFTTALVRTGMLLFYLIFIVVFIGFQVTGKEHRTEIFETLFLRGHFMQLSIWAFVISSTVQLIAGFYLNGAYKRNSPRLYQNFFSLRIILMHVLIVGSVFIHKGLFEGKTYAAVGEVVYIALFMLFKSALDLWHLSQEQDSQQTAQIPMI